MILLYVHSIFELSSLPLGAMNIFKSHPTWPKQYPDLYRNTRVAFALTFLVVRLLWCVPRMALYMLDMATFAAGLPAWSGLQIYLALNFIGATSLTAMQFLWGEKVVRGLWRLFLGKGSSGSSSSSSGQKSSSMAKTKAS